MLHSLTAQTAREIMHLAFRASYLKTFDALIKTFHDVERQPEVQEHDFDGFMSHVPLVAGCAFQVQLAQLLQTWARLSNANAADMTDIDHCVCYCAASHLARLAEMEDQRSVQNAAEGLDSCHNVDFLWLASKLRTLQITWPFATDSAVIVRDNYLDENTLDVPASKPIERCSQRDAILELVGQWTVSPEILSNAAGLLTQKETAALGTFFAKHPELMNLK